MKSRKWGYFSFLLAVFMLFTGTLTVHGADDTNTLTKEITYETEDADETKDAEFAETIEEGGSTFRLTDIRYEEVSREPIMETVTLTMESEPISGGESYQPEETIVEDGVTYQLAGTETARETIRVQTVTGFTDYDRPVTAEDVPAEKEVETENEVTGELEAVTLTFVDIEPLEPVWEDSYIDIVFEDYDADSFDWAGIRVTADTETPLAGHEDVLLSSVRADPGTTRVQRTYWAGEPYRDADGRLCRNARADIEHLVTYYRASYAGELETTETVYRASYTGEREVDGAYLYQMKAVASYEKETAESILPLILAGAGVVIVIALVIFILFILAKKKKKKESEPNGKKNRKDREADV